MRRPTTNADSQSAPSYHNSMSGQNDNNLINFIATAVETMRHRLDTISDQMATKIDLASLREQMARKDDLARVESNLESLQDRVDTISGQMATKEYLARVEPGLARIESTLEARTAAIRGDIEQVHIRLDSIDRGVGTRMDHVEIDISRLRSVLYLLVKDKPDMLRLLGQPTPGESRP